ncbi:MAG: hypothetical protein M5U12_11505 [Verrucomicrobia bacterium]|nr:hypothetical protein [Verrucomicrobiota bacterium]
MGHQPDLRQRSLHRGFKIGALKVVANSGTLSNVHVRNFGANGIAPLARYFAVQVECFPLSVKVPEFTFGANAQPVWFIENCEVSDFHSVRGGYCSAILVRTPNPPGEFGPGHFYTNRVAVVRRCQVRGIGNGIAFATADSAGITFCDNVVVGAALGMNTDTATEATPVRNIDLTNNVVLDVNLLANVGMSGRGADGSGNYLFTNITVSANTTRLRSVPWRQEYGSYEWRATAVGTYTNWLPVSDPSLPVGRLIPGYASGLLIGGADRIRFEHNRFTTWPRSQFYEPNPTNTALAIWRPLHKPDYHPVIGQACYHGPHLYAATNWLSSSSMDITALVALPAMPTNATSALAALPSPPADFIPHGRTMRAVVVADSYSGLIAVGEVQISQPEILINGLVRVRGRWITHTSVSQGGSSAVWYGPYSLRLRVRSASGAVTDLAPVSFSWTEPQCVFEYQPAPGPGRDELTLFDAPVANPSNPVPPGWDLETADTAWTIGEVLRGTTVRFERTADVADDRRLYPGLLRISRSTATGLLSLTLASVTNGVTRPALPEAYPNYDYDLHTNAWSSTNTWGKVLPCRQWAMDDRYSGRRPRGDRARQTGFGQHQPGLDRGRSGVLPVGHERQLRGRTPGALGHARTRRRGGGRPLGRSPVQALRTCRLLARGRRHSRYGDGSQRGGRRGSRHRSVPRRR